MTLSAGKTLAFGTGVVVIGALARGVGCDDAYEPPCRVTSQSVLVSDPAIGARPGIALARARGRAVASWPRRELPDAGVDAGSDPPPIMSLEIAVVDDGGGLGSRASVPTPEAFRARKGGVQDLGVVVEDGAFLVHWIETTITTDPDGRIRRAAALKAAYVVNGVISELRAPERGACEHCFATLAVVSLGTESVAFMRIDPDIVDATIGAPPSPSFAALRFRRDGTVVDEPAGWLALPSPETSDGGLGRVTSASPVPPADLVAEVDGEGRIIILATDRAWLADRALGLVSGPIELPVGPDPSVSWNGAGEASIAWSVSPSAEGRATAEAAPREIFIGRAPRGSSSIATRERVGRGRVTLALDRHDHEIGVLFESAGRTLFSALDPSGRKRGGDLLIDPAPPGSRGISEYGLPSIADAHAVFARGNGLFRAVTLGNGTLTSSEIRCVP